MTADIIRTLLLLVLAGLLVKVAHTDIISYRIPNKICMIIALLAPTFWIVDANVNNIPLKASIIYHLMIAGGVFFLFYLSFIFGKMGGGDVKLLAAIALWTPLPDLILWLCIMGISGGALALLTLYMNQVRNQRRRWFRVRYGVAIALGGILFVGQPFLKTLTLT